MVLMYVPELLLFIKNFWKKALHRIGPANDGQLRIEKNHNHCLKNTNMNSILSTNTIDLTAASMSLEKNNVECSLSIPTTTVLTSTRDHYSANRGSISSTRTTTTLTKQHFWKHKTVHFTIFLAVFSTILSLLWIYTLTDELRRKAFDGIMNKDDVFLGIAMDNPDLVSYVRNIHLKPTMSQEPLNVSQTLEEKFIANQLQNKRKGVYIEYINRIGAVSTTSWLEFNLNWHGVVVFTDPRYFFDACRSTRNPTTKVLLACLSSDKVTKEITYHHEQEVKITKLDESPNSLDLSKGSWPATRLKCFPLYTILLAYNVTSLDYLSLDSTEIQDELVLDTIPWELIKVSILSIYWGLHHTDAETTNFIEKLKSHSYKHIKSLPTGKLIFLREYLNSN